MRLIHIVLICIILFAFRKPSSAQSYSFREYSVLDGLPQSQVTRLFQDSRGFLWIATRNGVARFDGIDFVNYYRKDGLPSNFVFNIIENSEGRIWALTNEGLSKYNGYGFENFPLPDEFSGCTFSSGSSSDNYNNIILLGSCPGDTISRLFFFNDGFYSDYSAKYPALDTLNIKEFLFENNSNELLLVDTRKLCWLWKNETLSSLSTRTFSNIISDRGTIFAKSNDTIFRYSDKKFKQYKFNTVTGRSEVNQKSSMYNRELEFFDGRNDLKLLLPFNYLAYLIDCEGVLWFSSEGNLYRLLSTAFRVFSEEEISAKNIWAISADKDGPVWFGSLYNTLIEYNGKEFRERGEFKSLFKSSVSFYKGTRRMLNGDIWFSTNTGVLIWDGVSFSRLKGIPDETQICYIYEDPDNKTVMIGTEKGLFIIKNGNVNLLPEFNDASLGVIEGVVKDKTGSYWLSGHRGLIRFDGKNSIPVKESILPRGYTYTVEKDNHDGLWLTSDEGLYFRGKSSDSFVHGLPEKINRSASSIFIMDTNHIVVGRVSDICVIDLEKFYENEMNYFRIYDKTDGFPGRDCLDNGIVKDQMGRLWILTSNNVAIFDPLRLKQNPFPPKVLITGVFYQSDSLTWEPVEKSNFFYEIPDIIKLKRFQNKIQISFAGISSTNPEKVELQYLLEGYDDKWSLPSNKRSVIYEKLPPGHYTFRLKAVNADGVETSEPLNIKFRVNPFYWQTTLFQVGTFILILFSTVIVTLLIMKKRHRRKEEKENLRTELTRLQMNSILKQFDPHFTFNVISSVGSLIMKGEKEIAYDYITKFSGLLRTVLGDGTLIVKSLSDELDFVRRYCELQKLRYKDRFSFSIDIGEDIDLQRDIPKMVIQTFVENSLKHGFEDRKEGGKIDIIIKNKRNDLEIRILDNGVGRVAAAGHSTGGTGYGLKMISGLFELMNANNSRSSTIEITDLRDGRRPSGTEVIIRIPDDYLFEFGRKMN